MLGTQPPVLSFSLTHFHTQIIVNYKLLRLYCQSENIPVEVTLLPQGQFIDLRSCFLFNDMARLV